jgi:hypothetical protein
MRLSRDNAAGLSFDDMRNALLQVDSFQGLSSEWETAVVHPCLSTYGIRWVASPEGASGRTVVIAIKRTVLPRWKQGSVLRFRYCQPSGLSMWQEDDVQDDAEEFLFGEGSLVLCGSSVSNVIVWDTADDVFSRVTFGAVPLIDQPRLRVGASFDDGSEMIAPVCLMVPDQMETTYGCEDFYEVYSRLILTQLSEESFKHLLGSKPKIQQAAFFQLHAFREERHVLLELGYLIC